MESAGGDRLLLILITSQYSQVAASLMSNLEANVPSNDSDSTVAQRREHTMEKWMRLVVIQSED